LEFVKFLREDKTFSNLSELKEQLFIDKVETQTSLRGRSPKQSSE